MGPSAAALVAGIIDRIENRPFGPGRPPLPTIKVVETLRYFVREGVPWRELRATAGRACGSTLRRRLDDWSATALLRQVHVALIRMVRAGPEIALWDVVVDSCSVRAKRGGELTGPNPTDRGKAGTKYHVVVSTDGIPLGTIPSAANVHDTRLFPHLLRLAQVVCAAIGRLYADAGYDSAENRGLCLQDGIEPYIRQVGEAHGSGLGAVRCVVEHDCAWLLANKRLMWTAFGGQENNSSATREMRRNNRGDLSCSLFDAARRARAAIGRDAPRPDNAHQPRLARHGTYSLADELYPLLCLGLTASYGAASGQSRPYVRPVPRRLPLAIMGVRRRVRHQSGLACSRHNACSGIA